MNRNRWIVAVLAALALALAGLWLAMFNGGGAAREVGVARVSASSATNSERDDLDAELALPRDSSARNTPFAEDAHPITKFTARSSRTIAEPSAIVRVVDEQGRPQAGVHVAIEIPPKSDEGSSQPRIVWRAVTAGSGAVRVLRSRLEANESELLRARVFIEAPLRECASDSIGAAFDANAVVSLVLPATGRIVVAVPLIEGLAADARGWVTLFAQRSGDSSSSTDEDASWMSTKGSARIENGTAVFNHVGLDLSFEIVARVDGLAGDLRGETHGPLVAEEEKRIQLGSLGDKLCVLGHLVDEQRLPIGPLFATVEITSKGRDAGRKPMQLQTDASGVFVVPLQPSSSSEPVTLSFESRDSPGSGRSARLRGVVSLPPRSPHGVTDIGAVVLGGAPLVAAGRVVDQEGKPVVGARVMLVDDAAHSRTRRPAQRDLVDETREEEGTALSDRAGHFELRSFGDAGEIVLSTQAAGYFDSHGKAVERGVLDVELVLRLASALAGTVLVDPCVPLSAIQLSLNYQDIKIGPDRPTADGSFRFDQLKPGTAWLIVSVEGKRLDRLEITVDGDKPVIDPRLQPLDVRGRVRCIAIEVLDSDGRGVSGAQVDLFSPEGSGLFLSGKTVDGRASFAFPPQPVQVDIEYPGFKSVHLSQVESDQTVKLEAGPRVRFVLDGGFDMPPSPYRLGAGLYVFRNDPLSGLEESGIFATDRACAFRVSDAGPHELCWFLVGASGSKLLASTPGRTLIVREMADEQVFHLDLTREVKEAWELEMALLDGDVPEKQR